MNKETLLEHLDSPRTLESIYRRSPDQFRLALQETLQAKEDGGEGVSRPSGSRSFRGD